MASQVELVVKNTPAHAGDSRDVVDLIHGSGRSPVVGNGTLANCLVWRISQRDEPGGLQSMGWQRVRHN